MSLSKLYQSRKSIVSYELFPPRSERGEEALYRHVDKLCEFAPDFITCTYGAGGSTRDKTLEIVSNVKRRFGIPVASHLTLVGSTSEQLCQYLGRARDLEIDYIVALRGDPPADQDTFQPVVGGLSYANQLVDLIRDQFPGQFSVAVAGYPEKHQEADSLESDLLNLKRKVDAGADVVITQLFYDNRDYFQFRNRCVDIGIDVPIVPGILPVTNLGQVQRITSLCGAKLPREFVEQLESSDDPNDQFSIGVDFATQQVTELLEHDVPGIHFYVLNQSAATIELLKRVPLVTSRDA